MYLRLLILLIFAFAIVGCGDASAPPLLLNGVLCRNISPVGEPLDPTKEFSSTDSVIQCVLIFQQSENTAKIRGKWSVSRVSGIQNGKTIGEATVQVIPNSKYVNLSLTPTSPLPAGDYLLEVFVESDEKTKPQPDQTFNFKIVSKGAQVTSAFLATDPQGKQRNDVFPINTSEIYAHLKLADIPPRTTLTASWVQDGNGEIDRVPIILRRGEESVVFALTLENGLSAGNYHVVFFFNNQTTPVLTIPFRAVAQ